MKILARILPLLFTLSSVSGCGNPLIGREYAYTRQEPAVARRSPTAFTVRIRIDRERNSVIWQEVAHDSDGELGRDIKTWTGCTFLDDNNWECEPVTAPGADVVNQISMRDGNLSEVYWTENRAYRTQYKVFGFQF